MRRRLVTGPGLAITVAEAKANLIVEDTERDALIERLIRAAGAHVERDAGKAFGAQTWEVVLDDFPARRLCFTWGPVVSITSVTYRDAAGVSTPLASSAYALEAGDPGALLPVGSWPATSTGSEAVVVRYVAGLGWPEDVKQAVHLLVGHWFANRETVAEGLSEVPLGVSALLQGHRRMVA